MQIPAVYNSEAQELSYLGYRTVKVKDLIPQSTMPQGTDWYLYSARYDNDRQVSVDNSFIVFNTEQTWSSGDASNPLIGATENSIQRWTVFDNVSNMSMSGNEVTFDYSSPVDILMVNNGKEIVDFSAINIIQGGRMSAWLREYKHRNVTFEDLKSFIMEHRV